MLELVSDLVLLCIMYLAGLTSSLSRMAELVHEDGRIPRGRWIYVFAGVTILWWYTQRWWCVFFLISRLSVIRSWRYSVEWFVVFLCLYRLKEQQQSRFNSYPASLCTTQSSCLWVTRKGPKRGWVPWCVGCCFCVQLRLHPSFKQSRLLDHLRYWSWSEHYCFKMYLLWNGSK